MAKLQFKFFKTDTTSLLIRAGIVAGFSSLFGARLAALVFLREKFGFKQKMKDSATWALLYFYRTYFPQRYLRIFTAGIVIAILTWYVGSSKYNGLGVSLIPSSFGNISPWFDAVLKSTFTLVVITSGFKGGEVTPLIASGASLGSSVAYNLSLPLIAASAVGAIFFFAQTLGLPLTGAVLMVELFCAPSAQSLFVSDFSYGALKIQRFTWSSKN